MDNGMDYEPPDGLTEALREGNVDQVTSIFQDVSEDFPVSARIYGDDVKDSQVLNDPTALTLATEFDQIECVRKILLELGYDYYAFGVELEEGDSDSAVIPDDYFAALLIAFSKGHSEICQLLVEFRLFEVPGVADSCAEFITAVKQSDFVRFESLLDEVVEKEIFLKGWRGHNIMNLCLLYGCPCSCLKKMMDFGIGVNGWDYNGLTPLMCAIIGKNLACVQFLLDNGAEPYAPHLKECELFLIDGTIRYEESGSSKDQHRFGPSALMYAAAMGNIPILKLMLKAAPKDVGTRQLKNDGLLMFAIAYANIEAVGLVLGYKAVRDNFSAAPVILIMQRDDMEMLDLLLEKIPISTWKLGIIGRILSECVHHSYGSHIDAAYFTKFCELVRETLFDIEDGRCLQKTIDYDRFDLAKVLVALPRFNVNRRYFIPWFSDESDHGATCFMYSCVQGKIAFADFFFQRGADVNMVDEYQKTPVLNAVERNNVECLKFLIKINANLDVLDENGGSVFSAALTGDGDCLEILLQTKKLFEDNGRKLKSVHRQSINVFHRYWYDDDSWIKPISFKAARILVEYKIFNWEWCQKVDEVSMQSLMFAAVSYGISPGVITGRHHQPMSPFVLAIRSRDEDLIRYLLANLYFLPGDYQHLLKLGISRNFLFSFHYGDLSHIFKRLTSQPLSLHAWSVLHISQSLVKSSDDYSFPFDRNRKVDALPLPDCLKDVLKFKTKFSNLCVSHWKHLGPKIKYSDVDSGDIDMRRFDEIVMDGVYVRRYTVENCTDKTCVCQGVGKRVKPMIDSSIKQFLE